jgi:hypothetical protein
MTRPAIKMAMTSPPQSMRGVRGWGCLLMGALLLGACAVRAPRPESIVAKPMLSEEHSKEIVAEWTRRLIEYIDSTGEGDPAVLTGLPALRATGTLRPAQITFGVLDVEASAAEADGFDVQGLLLSQSSDLDTDWYVFVVGIVQRQGYWPVAIADIRLVGITVRDGRLHWAIGDSDREALARYRAAVDMSDPLRFPADKDWFELVPCAPRLCADELLTRTRWSLSPSRGALDAAPR